MEIELVTGIESVRFKIKDKYAESIIKKCLDEGKEFDLFFPDYEFDIN